MTRSLLERAVSDWSAKYLFRSVAADSDGTDRQTRAARKERPGSSASGSSSSSSSRDYPRTATPDGVIGDHRTLAAGGGLAAPGLAATNVSAPTEADRMRRRKRGNIGRGDPASAVNISRTWKPCLVEKETVYRRISCQSLVPATLDLPAAWRLFT